MDNKKLSVNISSSSWGLLAIVFITLKLLGCINWPWIWVLAPIWMPIAIGLIVLCIILIVCGVIGIVKNRMGR